MCPGYYLNEKTSSQVVLLCKLPCFDYKSPSRHQVSWTPRVKLKSYLFPRWTLMNGCSAALNKGVPSIKSLIESLRSQRRRGKEGAWKPPSKSLRALSDLLPQWTIQEVAVKALQLALSCPNRLSLSFTTSPMRGCSRKMLVFLHGKERYDRNKDC